MRPKLPADAAGRPLQPGSDEPPPEPVPGQDDPNPQPLEPPVPLREDEPQPNVVAVPCQSIPTFADTLLADIR